jgi:endoglucanase
VRKSRVVLACVLAGQIEPALARGPEFRVVVDQAGYPTGWDKVALVVGPKEVEGQVPGEGLVLDASSGREVLAVTLGAKRRAADGWVRPVPMRELPPGTFVLEVGEVRSAPFTVAPASEVYEQPLRQLLRAFYLQRCGQALDDALTGLSHEACHLQDAVMAHDDEHREGGQPVRAAGGWHDAGDYGKYVATAAVSMGRILAAFEQAPDLLGFDDLGIPESGNTVPDVLDEMKVGLDWMLTMQREDGALYRKIGGATWPHDLLPEADTQTRFCYGISTPETAKAAAVWALAARVYAGHDPEAAARYLQAARLAMAFLDATPVQRFDLVEGDDSGSGPYRSNEVDPESQLTYDQDDRLWAATELWLTTHEPQWLASIEALAPDTVVHLFEWKDPSSLALSRIALDPAFKPYKRIRRKARADLVDHGLARMEVVSASPYRTANDRYVWGSNKMTVEEGMLLLTAAELRRDRAMLEAARDQVHYVLGRNHFGVSFVSRVGARSVERVNHMLGSALDLPIPGLLVGGPNEQAQDGVAPAGLGPLSWTDSARSYATNEFAIDYNASLIGLLVALSDE